MPWQTACLQAWSMSNCRVESRPLGPEVDHKGFGSKSTWLQKREPQCGLEGPCSAREEAGASRGNVPNGSKNVCKERSNPVSILEARLKAIATTINLVHGSLLLRIASRILPWSNQTECSSCLRLFYHQMKRID